MIKLKQILSEGGINVKYWTQYHDGAHQIKGEFSKKSYDIVEKLVNTRIGEWEENPEWFEGRNINKVPKQSIKKIQTVAKDFFTEAGWISEDIIDAMIMQS